MLWICNELSWDTWQPVIWMGEAMVGQEMRKLEMELGVL